MVSEILQSISTHGYVLLFGWVLAEQLGLPIPAVPALLAAGILVGLGKFSFVMSAGLVLAACVVGDGAWFYLGRRYGSTIVNALCRMSFEPDSCVRKTSSLLVKHGPPVLLLAKFMPGIGTVAIPIAGHSRMSLRKFIAYDVAGCLLYVATFVGAGIALSHSIESVERLSAHARSIGAVVVLLTLVGILSARIIQRRRFLRDLRMARIKPEEVHDMIRTGEEPYIVDLRHALDFLPHPQVIPTAVRMDPDQLVEHLERFPRDRDIILYCT